MTQKSMLAGRSVRYRMMNSFDNTSLLITDETLPTLRKNIALSAVSQAIKEDALRRYNKDGEGYASARKPEAG